MDNNLLNALIFLGISILFLVFRTKNMNGLFGYRTPRSKKNLSNWYYTQRQKLIKPNSLCRSYLRHGQRRNQHCANANQ